MKGIQSKKQNKRIGSKRLFELPPTAGRFDWVGAKPLC
jgi:hypothetical protein